MSEEPRKATYVVCGRGTLLQWCSMWVFSRMSDQPVNILAEMLRSMAEMQRDKMGALQAAAQTQVLAELVPWLAGIAALRPPQPPSILLYNILVEDDLEDDLEALEAFKVATGAGGWLVEEWAPGEAIRPLQVNPIIRHGCDWGSPTRNKWWSRWQQSSLWKRCQWRRRGGWQAGGLGSDGDVGGGLPGKATAEPGEEGVPDSRSHHRCLEGGATPPPPPSLRAREWRAIIQVVCNLWPVRTWFDLGLW